MRNDDVKFLRKNLTFTNGIATFQLTGVTSDWGIVAIREGSNVTALTLAAKCSTDLVTVSLYNNGTASAVNGDYAINCIVYKL